LNHWKKVDPTIHIGTGSAIVTSSDAGIAQLVEHDLAKVGVASSSLVSRSSFMQNLGPPGFCSLGESRSSKIENPSNGRVAEWSCSGLQSRVRRFDSDLGLHCKLGKSAHVALFLCASLSVLQERPAIAVGPYASRHFHHAKRASGFARHVDLLR
jgi:hypothetical protein